MPYNKSLLSILQSSGRLLESIAICRIVHHAYTCNTSPSLATIWYRTGLTIRPKNNLDTNPATITIANGFCESDPTPVDTAAGSNPKHATSAVIMIGRNRTNDPSYVALRISCPSNRNLLM